MLHLRDSIFYLDVDVPLLFVGIPYIELHIQQYLISNQASGIFASYFDMYFDTLCILNKGIM
jgi:hypothetical protein